jgi:multisubunit Na+/H+ antiporter MnhG subunit
MYVQLAIGVILTLLAMLVYFTGEDKRLWRFALIVILITVALRISDPAYEKFFMS